MCHFWSSADRANMMSDHFVKINLSDMVTTESFIFWREPTP